MPRRVAGLLGGKTGRRSKLPIRTDELSSQPDVLSQIGEAEQRAIKRLGWQDSVRSILYHPKMDSYWQGRTTVIVKHPVFTGVKFTFTDDIRGKSGIILKETSGQKRTWHITRGGVFIVAGKNSFKKLTGIPLLSQKQPKATSLTTRRTLPEDPDRKNLLSFLHHVVETHVDDDGRPVLTEKQLRDLLKPDWFTDPKLVLRWGHAVARRFLGRPPKPGELKKNGIQVIVNHPDHPNFEVMFGNPNYSKISDIFQHSRLTYIRDKSTDEWYTYEHDSPHVFKGLWHDTEEPLYGTNRQNLTLNLEHYDRNSPITKNSALSRLCEELYRVTSAQTISEGGD